MQNLIACFTSLALFKNHKINYDYCITNINTSFFYRPHRAIAITGHQAIMQSSNKQTTLQFASGTTPHKPVNSTCWHNCDY